MTADGPARQRSSHRPPGRPRLETPAAALDRALVLAEQGHGAKRIARVLREEGYGQLPWRTLMRRLQDARKAHQPPTDGAKSAAEGSAPSLLSVLARLLSG